MHFAFLLQFYLSVSDFSLMLFLQLMTYVYTSFYLSSMFLLKKNR